VTRPGEAPPTAPRTSARFPAVPLARGHYESFYLKAADPARPVAVWIRYTVHKRPGRATTASLWFTLFDRAAGAPRASKVTYAASELRSGEGDYIRIGDSRFSPGAVVGSAASDALDAAWELELEPGDEPLRHLPREWMYRAPLPRTKLESPHPATRFSGHVSAGETRLELDGWPGMVGHNWGTEHAERWIWMHASGFGDAHRDAWLDVALGRVRVGGLTTPWIANGCLVVGGERHRLGGVGRVRATAVRETSQGCEFSLPGDALTLRGTVAAAREDFVGWVYADPAGPEHHTVNCSIAAIQIELRRPGTPPLELASDHGATYELGMREHDHGVPIQPFADG
jgi:hypothetical protein